MSTITPPSTLTPLPPPPIQTPLPLVQSDTSISSVGYNRLQSTIPASTPPIPPSAVDPAALSYLIISGGTGANSIAAAFGSSPAFVLPVSDDGGSSSEILRCFGGPSIGDIRSRLIRLIPLATKAITSEEKERQAIYNLLQYRFPAEAAEKVVRDLWMEIVEGRSDLWDGIGEDKKECLRAFLVHFQTLCLRRAHKRFSFRNFSLGNGFLTGARDLFGSLPSAIFLFKSVAGVSPGVQVIPAINTNQTVTIAAQLANATTLVGQCTISHPTPPPTPMMSSPTTPLMTPIPARQPALHLPTNISKSSMPYPRRDSRTFDTDEFALALERATQRSQHSQHSSEEEWSGGNLGYRKGEGEYPLEARIERIFYINLYGQEIFPEPNREFLDTLNKRDVLVYSCGSLWTSISPCLALRGLATAIAKSNTLKAKVLLINAMNDRETPGYTASEYVASILGSLKHFDRPKLRSAAFGMPAVWEPSRLVSHVAYLEGAKIPLDASLIEALGIKIVRVPRSVSGALEGETPLFSTEAVQWVMAQVVQNLAV